MWWCGVGGFHSRVCFSFFFIINAQLNKPQNRLWFCAKYDPYAQLSSTLLSLVLLPPAKLDPFAQFSAPWIRLWFPYYLSNVIHKHGSARPNFVLVLLLPIKLDICTFQCRSSLYMWTDDINQKCCPCCCSGAQLARCCSGAQ